MSLPTVVLGLAQFDKSTERLRGRQKKPLVPQTLRYEGSPELALDSVVVSSAASTSPPRFHVLVSGAGNAPFSFFVDGLGRLTRFEAAGRRCLP